MIFKEINDKLGKVCRELIRSRQNRAGSDYNDRMVRYQRSSAVAALRILDQRLVNKFPTPSGGALGEFLPWKRKIPTSDLSALRFFYRINDSPSVIY